MIITAEIIGKTTIGIAAIVSAWYAGRAMLKKAINDGDDPLERRKDSITRDEHVLCTNDDVSLTEIITIMQKKNYR